MFSDDILLDVSIESLKSLYKRSIDELRDAESPDIIAQINLQILAPVLVKMRQRIREIEKTIDKHINDLIDLMEHEKE